MKSSIRYTSFLLFLLAVLAMPSCAPKPEEIVQTFVTGEISRRHMEINGKKEGKMTEYYIDGKIKAELLFENDLQIGKTIYYYPSGKIMEVQYYVNGKINGGDSTFYENGKLQFIKTYNGGRMDGYIRKWNEADSIIYEARYSNDTLVEVKGVVLRPDSLTGKK